MAWVDPNQIVAPDLIGRKLLFLDCCFFSDPFSYLLEGIEGLATDVDPGQVVHSLEVFNDVMEVLGFADFRYTQE